MMEPVLRLRIPVELTDVSETQNSRIASLLDRRSSMELFSHHVNDAILILCSVRQITT